MHKPVNRRVQRRAAGAALVAGPAIFFLTEFVAAAAWTDPPYSYARYYISDLGVPGPSEALGQYMNSPLAWVMNTGFFLYGVMVFVGVALLRGLRGRHRWAVLVPAVSVAAGSVTVAFFHASAAAASDGTGVYHGLGAVAVIAGGNALVIILGCRHRLLGFPRRTGPAMVVLGVFGLVSLVALALADSRAGGLIGLVERCAVYPVLIGLVGAGVSIWRGRNVDTSAQSTRR